MASVKLLNEAKRVAALLKKKKKRLVLAESCTGGMVAATLAGIPGISEFLCGSAVTYRDDTKTRWLGVSRKLLKNPQAGKGAVSPEVAIAMARGVLLRTPEAEIAAAVTGHLGPNAPRSQDGLVYVAIVERGKSAWCEELWFLPQSKSPNLRARRQILVSHAVLTMLRSPLKQ